MKQAHHVINPIDIFHEILPVKSAIEFSINEIKKSFLNEYSTNKSLG